MSTGLYQIRGKSLNSGDPQSSQDLQDREAADIASILATNDLAKMGCYDGHQNSKSCPDSGIYGLYTQVNSKVGF